MPGDEDSRKVFQCALTLLAGKSLSCGELERKLRGKDFSEAAIAETLHACMERGYIDERERAFQVLRKALRTGHGPLRIRMDLKKMGISESLEKEVLEAAQRDVGEDLLIRTARKKLAQMRGQDLEKNKATLFRFLLSRGFAPQDVMAFIQNLPSREFSGKGR